jgi:hypothetical protein
VAPKTTMTAREVQALRPNVDNYTSVPRWQTRKDYRAIAFKQAFRRVQARLLAESVDE